MKWNRIRGKLFFIKLEKIRKIICGIFVCKSYISSHFLLSDFMFYHLEQLGLVQNERMHLSCLTSAKPLHQRMIVKI